MSASGANWTACFDLHRAIFEKEGWLVEGKVWNDGLIVVSMHPDNRDGRGLAGVSVWHASGLDGTVNERAIVALEQMRLRSVTTPRKYPSSAAAWLTILIEGYYAQFPEERKRLD